jgi:hypothetical protein
MLGEPVWAPCRRRDPEWTLAKTEQAMLGAYIHSVKLVYESFIEYNCYAVSYKIPLAPQLSLPTYLTTCTFL